MKIYTLKIIYASNDADNWVMEYEFNSCKKMMDFVKVDMECNTMYCKYLIDYTEIN